MNKTIRFFSFFLAVLLLISAVPTTAFAKTEIISGIAFVDASSLRLRSSTSTSSKTLATAARGEVVVVLGQQGDWYKVIYNLKEGYMHSDYLDVHSAENVELGYGQVNGSKVNLRSDASTSSKSVATASKGSKAYIIGVSNGWYKVIYDQNIGYIRSDYLDLTEVPYENKASSNSPKFFRGGVSTGTAPSADALGGTTVVEPSEPQQEQTTVTSAGVKQGIAYTTGSGLRLRASASTSSKTITSANKGEVVVITGQEGDWYKVIYNLKEGYMHSGYLNVKTAADVELGYGTINAGSVNLRSGAGTGNGVVATGSRGDKAYIIGINNGWYKVIYGQNICYIRSDYLDLTEAPYENKASSKSPLFFRGGVSTGVTPSASALNGGTSSAPSASTSTGTSTGTSTSTATGAKIVETAKKYLGVPYVWGGASPSGFDCSGFVYYVTRSLGFNTSRTLTAMYDQGTPVEKSDLQPGDIVFFKNTYKSGISHVGIYVGDGQFIHSPHTGKVVSFSDLYSDYYVNHYYGACRLG